jgi:hypothetical protein
VQHLSTHNANNNIADGETLDPNQVWSMSDQLDLGSRFLWLDLHWVAGQARLCHAHVVEKGPEFHVGCGPGDRLFGYALMEIKAWLDDNPDEIVLLDLEAYVEGNNAHVTDPISEIFGDKVLTVNDRNSTTRWPSRREMHAMKKRVIIGSLGGSFGGYTHPTYLPNNIEIRLIKNLEVTRTNGVATNCGTSIPGWSTLVANNEVFRVVGEDRTSIGLASNLVGVLAPQDVRDLAACNLPLVSFDMMSATRPTTNNVVSARLAQLALIADRLPGEELHRHSVWSWEENDRGRFGDAALMDGGTGRWRSASTSESKRYACSTVRSETRPRGTGANEWPSVSGLSWRVTTRSGPWKDGGRACFDEFGADGFVFAVPVNGNMNGRLRLAGADLGDVWLNYNDVATEGNWVINRRPVANAGPGQTVECTDHHGAQVLLNGGASTDLENHVLSYEWRGPFGVAFGEQVSVTMPAGRHQVQLIVDDGFGGVSASVVEINVIDTRAPKILGASATPSTLWPPDHKMRPVVVTVDVTDECDAKPACSIVSISSNESANTKGDGNTEVDWVITGALTAELRAERAGGGASRKYTVNIRCADVSGNFATRSVTVVVSHDQRGG